MEGFKASAHTIGHSGASGQKELSKSVRYGVEGEQKNAEKTFRLDPRNIEGMAGANLFHHLPRLYNLRASRAILSGSVEHRVEFFSGSFFHLHKR